MKKILSVLYKIVFFLLPFPIMALIVFFKVRKAKKEAENNNKIPPPSQE